MENEQLLDAGITGGVAGKMRPAGRWRRFFNMTLDGIFQYILIIVAAGAYGVSLATSGADPGILQSMLWLVYVAAYGLFFLYYVVLEAATGRTPAKYITGTKVVNEQGEPPSLRQVVIRTLVRLVPFELFSFLASDARGWHDQWSKTFVVRT